MQHNNAMTWFFVTLLVGLGIGGLTTPHDQASSTSDFYWDMFDVIHGRRTGDEFLRPQVPQEQQDKELTDDTPGLEEWSYPSETMEEIEIID